MLTVLPPTGLFPAVGMHSEGEEVRLNLDARWQHSGVTLMSIDSCEEDWSRLHDVRINGQVNCTTCCRLLSDSQVCCCPGTGSALPSGVQVRRMKPGHWSRSVTFISFGALPLLFW